MLGLSNPLCLFALVSQHLDNSCCHRFSLSKCTTLVFDSFAISAVDDFGSSSSLLLIMLDLSMSKSSHKPSEYRLVFTSASAMLLTVHMLHYTGSGVF